MHNVELFCWRNMIARCNNPKNYSYKNYGNRGITVCDEWLKSFNQFLLDMGPRPSKNHSLDRIDNNKGYYKQNCRWATLSEQAKNKRKRTPPTIPSAAILITYLGKTQSISDWAREKNLKIGTLWKRIYKLNWPLSRALICDCSARGHCA